MGSQVVQREKLNESELLTNFPRLIQAWAGPLGAIPHGPEGGNGSCYASLPLLCLCSIFCDAGAGCRPLWKGGWPLAPNVAVWMLVAVTTKNGQSGAL